MTSSVLYTGGLRTVCTHLRSGAAFDTDAPTDNQGMGARFSPTDLTATSLATCMLTVMGIKARTMEVELEGIQVDVEKLMATEPRRISGINLTFHIPAHLEGLDEKTRAILRHTAQHCPVQYSLHPDIRVQVDWGAWKAPDLK